MALLFSCINNQDKNFDFVLKDKTIIKNQEQNNSTEGQYLKVLSIIDSCTFEINFPENFLINNSNKIDWYIGWGNQKAYYDAGVENLRLIKKIDIKNKTLQLGDLKRGSGYPDRNQFIVFWNKKPSGFSKLKSEPIISVSLWPDFNGASMHLGAIIFDSAINKWCMLVNEFNTDAIQIYAATSENLIDWQVYNNGNPILKQKDFNDISWSRKQNDNTLPQVPILTGAIHHNGKWHLFLYGYDNLGRRNIGTITSQKSILGPYKIMEKPMITPTSNSWNETDTYYPQVEKENDEFILFYDGKNKAGIEQIGMAKSKDLTNWVIEQYPVQLPKNSGWRNNKKVCEPCNLRIKNDSIFLTLLGAKKFKDDYWSRNISKKAFKTIPGNVDDGQLGVFLSLDGGQSFIEHSNNPIFVNDYTDIYENEHMGANFEIIETDTASFIFYQAKSSHQGLKYNIHMRYRLK